MKRLAFGSIPVVGSSFVVCERKVKIGDDMGVVCEKKVNIGDGMGVVCEKKVKEMTWFGVQ